MLSHPRGKSLIITNPIHVVPAAIESKLEFCTTVLSACHWRPNTRDGSRRASIRRRRVVEVLHLGMPLGILPELVDTESLQKMSVS